MLQKAAIPRIRENLSNGLSSFRESLYPLHGNWSIALIVALLHHNTNLGGQISNFKRALP